MEIKLSTHFNKMTRDSKKELLQFHVTGEIENEVELNALVGEVVEIKVHELESLTAEFKKNSKDAKRTVLEFIVNPGKSNKHSFEYFSFTGQSVQLSITQSDMDIEEFREGLKVKVNADGTAEVVDENQTTLEQFTDPMDGIGEDDEQEEILNEETRSEKDQQDQTEEDDNDNLD
ncbi:MAG: hypothetical protein NAG76_22255 [Candidatus Pristimantibacillus lignocellulolyticus]|uniref:Uncharacterized protein n=1 Tax=Candidatus Pristimantibacillus lignocellulolyticus TaxID=2994561 RepID=A0A9J6ZEC4_9BACL|nr:MAG: hypothetical protein NAG76_22255 [Candidatus Pristimantibacillus lignocellulolyticus]